MCTNIARRFRPCGCEAAQRTAASSATGQARASRGAGVTASRMPTPLPLASPAGGGQPVFCQRQPEQLQRFLGVGRPQVHGGAGKGTLRCRCLCWAGLRAPAAAAAGGGAVRVRWGQRGGHAQLGALHVLAGDPPCGAVPAVPAVQGALVKVIMLNQLIMLDGASGDNGALTQFAASMANSLEVRMCSCPRASVLRRPGVPPGLPRCGRRHASVAGAALAGAAAWTCEHWRQWLLRLLALPTLHGGRRSRMPAVLPCMPQLNNQGTQGNNLSIYVRRPASTSPQTPPASTVWLTSSAGAGHSAEH